MKTIFAARVGNLNSTCRVSISEINSHLKQILADQDAIIKQNSELATKLDKILNKTTCEVGGQHPSGGENLDFNTSPTEHPAEHHITPAVSDLTTECEIAPANSGLTSDDVLL